MTRHYITMGGAKYDHVTEQVIRDAKSFGIDEVWVYDDVWVSEHPFRKLNAWLWDHPGDRNGKRGFGWYAWKPLLLIHALDHVAPGDVVLYVDADTRPIAYLSPVYNHAAEHGAMFFAASAHSQHRWCKRDCYIAMGQDEDKYRYVQAGVARFMAMRAFDWKERQFLYEWLTYSVNRYATTFDASRYTRVHENVRGKTDWDGVTTGWRGPSDDDQFQEHRTEQAIMTNLCHKYGHVLHREACEAGNEFIDGHLNSAGMVQIGDYPQLFTQMWLGSGHAVEGSRFRRVPR